MAPEPGWTFRRAEHFLVLAGARTMDCTVRKTDTKTVTALYIYIYIYIHTHTHTHTYTYILTHRRSVGHFMHILRPHPKYILGSRTINYFAIKLHVLSPEAVFLSPVHLLISFKYTPLYRVGH